MIVASFFQEAGFWLVSFPSMVEISLPWLEKTSNETGELEKNHNETSSWRKRHPKSNILDESLIKNRLWAKRSTKKYCARKIHPKTDFLKKIHYLSVLNQILHFV